MTPVLPIAGGGSVRPIAGGRIMPADSNVAATGTETAYAPVPATSTAPATQPSYPASLTAAVAAIPGLVGANLNWTTSDGGKSYVATDPFDPQQQLTFLPGANNGAGGWDVSNPYTGQYDSGLLAWPATFASALANFGGAGYGGAPDTQDFFEPASGSSSGATTTAPATTTTTDTTDPYAAEEALAAQLATDNSAAVPGSGSIAGDVPTVSTTTTSSGGANYIAIVAVVAVIGLIVYYFWRKKHKAAAE